MQSPSEMLGQIIASRWQIVEFLGEGNMSYVYRAQDTQTGKVIALKLIKDKVLRNISNKDNLAKKAKEFIALNHENISSYYDVYLIDGQLFLLCDYLQGQGLMALLSGVGKLPLNKCVGLFQQVALGLEYAHGQKLFHGDLRPSNIFIVNDQFNSDEPKIVDFGFMQLIEQAGQQNGQRVTTTHPIFGNAPYSSPEQRIGQKLDARSDLYTLGCLMYEAACGKSPFDSKSAMETTYKQKNQAPAELSQILPPDPLLNRYQQVTNKLLQIDPKKRYQSAQSLAEDLGFLISAKDIDWQKKANVLKKSKYSIFLQYKWQTITIVFLVAILALSAWCLPAIMAPYFLPWSGKPLDNNQLWIIREKNIETPSPRLVQLRDLQIAKVCQIEKTEGKSSASYIKNLFILCQYFLACGQWVEAHTRLEQLQTTESATTLIASADLLSSLAFSQLMTDDMSAAEQSANKVLSISASADKTNPNYIESKMTALKILGDIYNQKNEIQKAENIYTELYQTSKAYRLNKPAEYAYAGAVLADIWRKERKFNQSEALYKQSIDWGENYIGHQQIFMAKALYGLALDDYQLGDIQAAQNRLKQALPIAVSRRGLNNNLVLTIQSFSDYLLFHQNIFAWVMSNLEKKR